MAHSVENDAPADTMHRARWAAGRAGYKTQPLEVPIVSGLLPEEDRKLRGIYALSPRDARKERVAVPTREVVCYECGKVSDIPVAALSAHCVHCHTHLNTANITLKPGSRRLTVRTLGDVTLPADVALSHLSITCRNLTVSGKGEGNLRCTGELTLRGTARLEGQVQAGTLRVAAGARASIQPGASAHDAEIEGHLTGRLHIKDLLHISRGGRLTGDCLAPHLAVDPGGLHDGHWAQS